MRILCTIYEPDQILIEQRRGCHFCPPVKCVLWGYPFQPTVFPVLVHLSVLWLFVCKGHPVNMHTRITHSQIMEILLWLPLVTQMFICTFPNNKTFWNIPLFIVFIHNGLDLITMAYLVGWTALTRGLFLCCHEPHRPRIFLFKQIKLRVGMDITSTVYNLMIDFHLAAETLIKMRLMKLQNRLSGLIKFYRIEYKKNAIFCQM